MAEFPVYLDYNATTPLDKSVIQVITKTCNENWANPSSSYELGRRAKEVVNHARAQVGQLVDAELPEREIIFTSGGTEASYIAFHSAITEFKNFNSINKTPHIVTTNIEHCATELPLKRWKEDGTVDVTFVNVENGRVATGMILDAIRNDTCLVTCIMANNETGVIQPVEEIAKEVKELNRKRKSEGLFPVFVHTDAAQTIGKVPVSVVDMPVDYLTIVGHKFYGPRIGALYHRESSAPVHPIFLGGGQEFGLRSGTENTPMIAGLGQAAKIVHENLRHDENDLREKRDFFEALLKNAFTVQVNFESQSRLPNTSSIFFPDIKSGSDLLSQCSEVFSASTAAACHSSLQCSSVLVKSGLTAEQASKSVRFSVGKPTTKKELEEVVNKLQKLLCQSK